MYQAPSDPRNEELVSDRQLDDTVQFLLAALKHGIKLLGLRNCTRETVQYESARLEIALARCSGAMFISQSACTK